MGNKQQKLTMGANMRYKKVYQQVDIFNDWTKTETL